MTNQPPPETEEETQRQPQEPQGITPMDLLGMGLRLFLFVPGFLWIVCYLGQPWLPLLTYKQALGLALVLEFGADAIAFRLHRMKSII
jgi:hypothetical protein